LTPANYGQFVGLIMLQAQILAYHSVFLVGTVIVFVGAFTVLWLKIPETAKVEKVHAE